MHCLWCGCFMRLMIAMDIGANIEEAAFWWVCMHDGCWAVEIKEAIAAPEYDWRYW